MYHNNANAIEANQLRLVSHKKNTHTHTHTHIYIYIYIYIKLRLRVGVHEILPCAALILQFTIFTFFY